MAGYHTPSRRSRTGRDSARVVALGENHGHLEFHDWVLRLLETPGAAGTINDIAVERINASLAPELQYRMLLADSPINWARIDSATQVRPHYDRAQSMADVVRRESLLKGRWYLFVAGGLHVFRVPRVRRSRLRVPIGEITPIAWIELRNPGTTFVIQSMGSAEKLGLSDLVCSGAPRVMATAGSALGATQANSTTTLRPSRWTSRSGGRSHRSSESM